MKPKPRKISLTARIDPTLKEALERDAERRQRSVSYVLNDTLMRVYRTPEGTQILFMAESEEDMPPAHYLDRLAGDLGAAPVRGAVVPTPMAKVLAKKGPRK